MDTEQLTQIVTQVLKRMYPEEVQRQNKSRVLLILDDQKAQLSCLEPYKYLFEEYSVCLLTAKGTGETLQDVKFVETYTADSVPADISSWVRQFDRILVPCPSLKLISKLAHILLDDKISEVVFTALQENKQVMLGPLADEKTSNLTVVLKAEIKRLVDKLKGYGIKELTVNKATKNNVTKSACGTKEVISLRDVTDSVKNGGELCIRNGAIITPLAMDYIKERKIVIRRVG